MNYPKVCFGCSRPHITSVEEEVNSEDGKRSYHVNCHKADDIAFGIIENYVPIEEKTEETE